MFKNENKYNLLFVEENEKDFISIQKFLKEKFTNHSLTRCRRYTELDKIKNRLEFDLVLLDLGLPDVEVNILMKKVCEIFCDIPIIILTDKTFEDYGMTALNLGALDYLIKENLTPGSLFKSIIYSIERKSNLLLVEKSHQLYQDLFQFNPQPTWVYDFETLKFLDVNKQALEKYGYTEAEFLEMTLKDIRPATEISKLNAALKDSKKPNKLWNNKVFKHKKKNGTEISVKIDSKTINYKDKLARIIVATDISEEIEYQNIIEKQNKELKQITWAQSHLVRSPVTKILGITEETSWEILETEERLFLFEGLKEAAKELDLISREIIRKSETIIQPKDSVFKTYKF